MGLIDDKLNAILKADTALSDALKRIDQQLAIEIIKIYSDFVIDGDLVLDATKLAQIDEAIIAAISSTDYKLAVDEFIPTFEEIEELNKQLHKAVNDEDITKILESNDRINNFKKGVEDQLRGTPTRVIQVTDADGTVRRVPFANPALDELITPIGEMVRRDVISGTSFKAATEQMLEAIKKNKIGLEQWAGQIARDSLEQADGITQQAVKDELGLKYSRYIGGLMSTSRPICYHLMTQKSDPVYSDEEIQDVLDEYAPGGIPSSSKITYSPLGVTRTAEKGSGIIPGTDSNNFHQRRGGYNCHHRMIPLSKKENEKKLLAESDEDEAVAQTEFKPAKTIKEAEQFAIDNGITQKISFDKSPIKSANIINKRLYELQNKYKTDPLKIINNSNRKRNANASANGIGMSFKKSYTKSGLKPVKVATKKERLDNLAKWDKAKTEKPELFTGRSSAAKTNRRNYKKVQEAAKWERFNVSSSGKVPLEYTTTHEFAHVIERQYFNVDEGLKVTRPSKNIKFNSELAGDFMREWDNIWTKTRTSNDKYVISEYSQYNRSELFAETFTMYHHEKSKLPKVFVDYHDKLLKAIESEGIQIKQPIELPDHLKALISKTKLP